VALLAIHLGILHLAAWSLRMSWMVMWGSALSCLCNVVDWGDHMLDMYIGIYIYIHGKCLGFAPNRNDDGHHFIIIIIIITITIIIIIIN
jgi:hypothetical protein